MGVYQGVLASSGLGNLRVPAITTDISSVDALQWPPYYQSSTSASPASVAPFRTLALAYARTLPGVLAGSYFNDYYNRIHVRPSSLNLGNVLTQQTRTVEVWNSYLTGVTLNSISVTAGQGVSIAPASGQSYAPNQSVSYTLQAVLSGPPAIAADVVFAFDVGTYDLPVTGNRVVVFPFRPEWSQKVTETLSYLTAVSRSRNGTEQRMALRDPPRRIYEFTVQLTQVDAAQFEQLVWGWDGRYFALPLWTESTPLLSPILAGATTLSADLSDRTFVAGGLVVLYTDPQTFEAGEIDSVSGSTITLTLGTANAWPAGTRVVPAALATLDNDYSINRLTSGILQAGVTFTCDPQTTDARAVGGTAPATYNGDELYTGGTDWATGVNQQVSSDYLTVDSGSGIFKPYQKSGWPTFVKPHRWHMRSRSDITAMRQWVARRAGRWKPVWMPTGMDDLILLSTVSGTATTMTVSNQGYATYGSQVERNRILIQLNDGTTFARQITASSVIDNQTQQLIIDSALGQTITPDQVRRISFLQLYRLASDDVSFVWETATVATLDLNMQGAKP